MIVFERNCQRTPFKLSEYVYSSWQCLWFWRDLTTQSLKNKRNSDYRYKSKKGK